MSSSTNKGNKYSGEEVYISGDVFIERKRIKFSDGTIIRKKSDLKNYCSKFGIRQQKKINWQSLTMIVAAEGKNSRNKIVRAKELNKKVVDLETFINEFNLKYELVELSKRKEV